MAKSSKSTSFISAVISKGDMTITEYKKDTTKVYNLDKLLSDWDGVEGITLTIKQDNEIPADE